MTLLILLRLNIFSQKEARDPRNPNQESRLNSTVYIQSESFRYKKHLSMKVWSLHSDLWCFNCLLCPQIATGCADLVPAQSGGLILPFHASVWIPGWLWWVWKCILLCLHLCFWDRHYWIYSAIAKEIDFTQVVVWINYGEEKFIALCDLLICSERCIFFFILFSKFKC